jgi:hypothetical protein
LLAAVRAGIVLLAGGLALWPALLFTRFVTVADGQTLLGVFLPRRFIKPVQEPAFEVLD